MPSDETCRCDDIELMWDDDAVAYEHHLKRAQVKNDGHSIVYVCPKTEWVWLSDHPFEELQAGGPRRLCRMFWKNPPGGPSIEHLEYGPPQG